ncbi:MAG TPA: metallophosphoesterase [bacterium]|nr:metallophosphoesterase [bacterium]
MKNVLFFALFLVAFYSVYTLLHWFFWRGLNQSFVLPVWAKRGIIAFFALMYLFPIANHASSALAGTLPCRGVAWIGFVWLGFLFYYLFVGGAFELAAFAVKRFAEEDLPRRALFIAASALSVMVIAYGFHEASRIQVRHHTVTTAKLPEFITKIRIVQVSDVHFSQLHGVEFADRLTALIKEQRPDLIVLTGDFLDRGLVDEEGIAAKWRALEAPLGKYAVTGNHEFYNGIDHSVALIEKAGFTLLRNRGETRANNAFIVAGVDDPAAARFGEEPPTAKRVLESLPSQPYRIFLRHQPKDDPEIAGLFDLQFSGHTHNGQIWPFSLFVSIPFPMRGGLYPQKEGGTVVVSSGAGTWGPPIRVLAPPDIVVVDLIRKVE